MNVCPSPLESKKADRSINHSRNVSVFSFLQKHHSSLPRERWGPVLERGTNRMKEYDEKLEKKNKNKPAAKRQGV